MTIEYKKPGRKHTIDLDGPEGNAYVLMGKARYFLSQMSSTEAEINAFLDEMKAYDYEHLIQTFDKRFGHFVTLLRSEPEHELED